MKIAVTITVELEDPAQWTEAFGVEGAANIRQDVKVYVGYGVQSAGVFGDGEVAADIAWR
ncbi:hypothetical protein ACH4OW_26140 [Streptomyces sp. NPDC017056]|uniref:hypothetical protein n=1 Tax=Streptomyces sp. NPDC017056 TaxID=3364973 RepID=UPI0037920CAC